MRYFRQFIFRSSLFHGLLFLLIQPGCRIQFTPGDGICGNGVLEDHEMCDGSDFGGKACSDWSSYEHGELLCTEDCKVDLTMCHTCGNGRVEGPEDCDGEDLGGETCESLGLGTGELLCNDNCTYDTSGCETTYVCGNNIVEPGEVCDGDDLGGQTCETQGFYAGALACFEDCSGFDSSGCGGYCGDGTINGEEVCDGDDLAGQTCESFGFNAGDLACGENCAEFDTSVCYTDPLLVTWIFISGGTFDMGSNDGESNEQPLHSVTVPTFEMTKTQVTVEQYEECVTDGVCTALWTGDYCNWDDPGYEDHPANCITWYQAREFCEWAGGRLPSEAEWEYAARSGGQDITYPWGNETATCDYAVMNDGGWGCGTDRTWPVCSKVAGNTDQGLCDMAGNVWEWVEDDYHGSYDCDENPTVLNCDNGGLAPTDGSAWVDDPRGDRRVRRGGSFNFLADDLRAAWRYPYQPSAFSMISGFRCAREAPE